MSVPVSTPEDIGTIVRAERKRQGLRQEDLAALIDSSHVALRDVEQGKPGVHLARVLKVLQALGIRVELSVPGEVEDLGA